MKRKHLSALIATLLAAVQLLAVLPGALADGPRDVSQEDGLITILNADFQLFESDGTTPIPPSNYDNVPQNARFKIQYNIRVEDVDEELAVVAGNIYTLDLPAALANIATFTALSDIPVTVALDGTPVEIGRLAITADDKLSITFGEGVNNLFDVDFYLDIQGMLDAGAIGDDTTVSFQLWAEGKIYVLGFEDDPRATIQKNGSYDPVTKQITWTITVNSGGPNVTIEGVKVVDKLGAGQTFVRSTPDYTSVSGNEYTYALGSVTDTETITVVTKVTDDAYGKVENGTNAVGNDVELFIKGFDDAVDRDDALVNVTTNWVNKEGVSGIAEDGRAYIDWIITLNNDGRTIPAGSTFVDNLPKYLVLDAASLLRDGAAPAAPDSLVLNNPGTPGTPYSNFTPGKFTYTFGQDVSGVTRITFRTWVHPDYYKQQSQTNFINNGTLNIKKSETVTEPYTDSSPGVGVGTSLISKSGGTYDPATQLLTWAITVNRNRQAIIGAYLEDVIGPNQEFYTGFTPTYQNGAASGPLAIAASHDAAKDAQYGYFAGGGKLTVGLGTLTASDTIVITFQTKATNPNIYASNNTTGYINNSATLYSSSDIEISVVTGTPHNASSTVITKAHGAYDYATREVEWTVTVNDNLMVMPNAIATDTIQANHDFVPDSLTIDGVPFAHADGDDAVFSLNGKVLTIRLGTLNGVKRVIKFKTRVINPEIFLTTNGDVVLTNRATLSSGIPGAGLVSVKSDLTIPNRPITKQGANFVSTQGYISWTSDINPHMVNMVAPKLYDQLQDGLELDIHSVKLYYLVRNAGNALVPGGEVTENFSFTYDYNSREFKLNLPDGPYAYRLVFNTDVLKPGTFRNAISFEGAYGNPSGASGNYTVSEAEFGAGGSGRSASITVIKADAEGNVIAREGIQFMLLDSKKNEKKLLTTDECGQIKFTGLKKYTYYIREVKAPYGYAVDPVDHMVIITEATPENPDALNPIVRIANELLSASITLRKVGENPAGGNPLPLAGIVFGLFRPGDDVLSVPPVARATSDGNGYVRFTDIVWGNYIVYELAPKAGYLPLGSGIPVSLTPNGENLLPDLDLSGTLVENTLIRAKITIQKLGELPTGGTAPLADGLFSIYAAGDTEFANPIQANVAPDAAGVVTFDGLLPGTYVIREVEAGTGYSLSTETRTVTLTLDVESNTVADAAAAPLVNYLLRANITLNKTDESGRPLTGGRFGIYAANDAASANPLQIVRAEKGVVRFTGLLAGDYKIREIEPPYAYQLTREVVEVSLVLDGERNALDDVAIEKALVNKGALGMVELMKVDHKHKPLAGAKFGLYLNGYLVDTATSDTNGFVRFYGILFGTYTIKEISAPAGYAASGETLIVNVTSSRFANRPANYTVVNVPVTGVPQTGGGNEVIGFALMGLGLVVLIAARRRRRANRTQA